MGVLPQIAKRLEELDWMLPTDVQAEAVPLILGGGDVLMAAETGSGKTGNYQKFKQHKFLTNFKFTFRCILLANHSDCMGNYKRHTEWKSIFWFGKTEYCYR